MTHQQHHLGTSQECRIYRCFPDLLNQRPWGPGLAICFKKPSLVILMQFGNQSLSPSFMDANQDLSLLLWLST